MRKFLLIFLMALILYGCDSEVTSYKLEEGVFLNSYKTESMHHVVFKDGNGKYISFRVEYNEYDILGLLKEGEKYNVEYRLTQYGSIKVFTVHKIEMFK